MTLFDIVLQTRASLHPDGEPDRFVTESTGFLHAEGDDGIARRVGKVRAYRLQAGLAADAGESLFDVCNAHSQWLHELHGLLYEPAGYDYRPAIAAAFDAIDTDLLILDYVVIHPKWRGLRLGLLAARKLADLLGGGCGLIVSHVAPLRHDADDLVKVPPSWLPQNRTPAQRRDAVAKLRHYYRAMGFRRIERSPFYGLSMIEKTPGLAELLKASVR